MRKISGQFHDICDISGILRQLGALLSTCQHLLSMRGYISYWR